MIPDIEKTSTQLTLHQNTPQKTFSAALQGSKTIDCHTSHHAVKTFVAWAAIQQVCTQSPALSPAVKVFCSSDNEIFQCSENVSVPWIVYSQEGAAEGLCAAAGHG
jgi:hypothetical protein